MSTPSFIFGGNTGISYEELQGRRKVLEAMVARQRGRAPQNVGEGLQALGEGILNGIEGRTLRNAQEKANASASDDFKAAMAGFQPLSSQIQTPAPATYAAPPSPSSPAGGALAASGDGLRDGIVSTAQSLGIDPTDLATAISYETAGTFDPTKKGPTTQWGQHRGLIQFGEPQAKQYGVNWDDPLGSQLGPDGAVAKYLRDTGVKPGMGLLDIYSAINAGGVGRYDRSDANNGGAPGTVQDKVNNQMAGHRAKALALLGSPEPQPTQVASLDGSIGMSAPSPVQTVAAAMPQDQPAAPSQAVQRVAQAMPSPPAGGMNDAVIRALSNPAMPEGQRRVLGAMLERQQAVEQARYKAQLGAYQLQEQRAYDRMTEAEKRQYEAGVRQEGYQREDARNAYTDARQGSRDARSDMESDRNFNRQVQQDQKPQIIEVFDEATGRAQKGYMDQNQNFVPVGGVQAPTKSNGVVVRGPDGSLVQVGGDTPALTEGQSKDAVYSTRARGALGTLDQYAPALMGLGDRAREAVPFGLARSGQSTDFQLAKQAGNEFLQAILRKDTGAAITGEEEALYGVTYLPQPGDSPELLAQKQQSRSRAVAAIEAGMPPSAIVAQEMALRKSSDAQAVAQRGGIVPGSDANPVAAGAAAQPAALDLSTLSDAELEAIINGR